MWGAEGIEACPHAACHACRGEGPWRDRCTFRKASARDKLSQNLSWCIPPLSPPPHPTHPPTCHTRLPIPPCPPRR